MQTINCIECGKSFESESWLFGKDKCDTCIRQKNYIDAQKEISKEVSDRTHNTEIEKIKILQEIEREKDARRIEADNRRMAVEQAQRDKENQIEFQKIQEKRQTNESARLKDFITMINGIVASSESFDTKKTNINVVVNNYPEYHENLYHSLIDSPPFDFITVECIKSYFFKRLLQSEKYNDNFQKMNFLEPSFGYFFIRSNSINSNFYFFFFKKYIVNQEDWNSFITDKINNNHEKIKVEKINNQNQQKATKQKIESLIQSLTKNKKDVEDLKQQNSDLQNKINATIDQIYRKGLSIGIPIWVIFGIIDFFLIKEINFEHFTAIGFVFGALAFGYHALMANKEEENKKSSQHDFWDRNKLFDAKIREIESEIAREKRDSEYENHQFAQKISSLENDIDKLNGLKI